MGPEIDAMKILQRPRQLWHYRRQGQDYRNDGAFALHELVQKCLNLLILPRSKGPVTHKHRGRFYILDLLSQRRLPRHTRPDLVFVQPRFDAYFDLGPTLGRSHGRLAYRRYCDTRIHQRFRLWSPVGPPRRNSIGKPASKTNQLCGLRQVAFSLITSLAVLSFLIPRKTGCRSRKFT